jgi:rhodanese-related sulfurtransferase
MPTFETLSFAQCRSALLEKRELAILDVREEAPFSEAHPLFAANLPLSKLEVDAARRIPRSDTLLVLYDNGEGLAQIAAGRLARLGYSNIKLLADGLGGWRDAGGELFSDVNSASKAFGELVESARHTPSLSAPELQQLLDDGADIVVLDARRYDEYNTMSIPKAVSVPGAELVLRARALAPRPETRIIVNCAGRTRSIIGTQSLVNAGLPNQVTALRNGTIGWTLAGQTLQHGQTRRFNDAGPLAADQLAEAQSSARAVADRAGVGRADARLIAAWLADNTRTTYRFDVRTPEENAHGQLSGFRSAPGGQLVQETDHSAPVRGARIVLADDDGVRANMTASWLAQMGWDVHVLDGLQGDDFKQTAGGASTLETFSGKASADVANAPDASAISVSPRELADWLSRNPVKTIVIDAGSSANYVKQHLPGAWFAIRSQLRAALTLIPPAKRYVITCENGQLSRHAVADLQALAEDADIFFLEGGTAAWIAAGHAIESGETALASPRIDRYRRPYEGTGNRHEAMQAYLDWEYGLVAQLGRDGTHGFFVV